MIRLFIENEEVELGENFSCPITSTFESLENPTSIINNYSKTITLPRTSKNNRIFNYLYNPDRQIIESGGESSIFLDFDPYKKLNFRLQYGDNVLMVGYLKVLQVSNNGYECTLNAELGKVFQELQKLTFDDSLYEGEEKDKYYIDGKLYEIVKLNKETIKNSWTSPDNNTINFIRNDAFSTNFNYKVSQRDDKDYETQVNLVNVLNNRDFQSKTNITADNIVGDGIKPRDFMEYRSYNQIPTIRFKTLFEILEGKIKQLTDYTLVKDTNWFKDSNPYWKDYSMLLRIDKTTTFSEHPTQTFNFTLYDETQGDQQGNKVLNWTFNDDENVIKDTVGINMSFKTVYTSVYTLKLSTGSYLKYTIKNGDNVISTIIFCAEGEKNNYTADYIYELGTDIQASIIDEGDYHYVSFDASIILNNIIDSNYNINFDYESKMNGDWLFEHYISEGYSVRIKPTTNAIVKFDNYSLLYRQKENLILNDLWDNNYTFYEQIIKYCKIFNLKWIADDYRKTITIIQQADYFKDYKILDWTDKLNKSKDFIVKPIVFENKYILFNTENYKVELNENYKKLYNFNIGEKNIITNYNFNTETKNLFDKVKFPVVYSPTVLYWQDLLDSNVVYTLPAEIVTNLSDKDDKEVDSFGIFGFLKQGTFDIKDFDNKDLLKITDDYLIQSTSDKPVYNRKLQYIGSNNYLYLDDKSDVYKDGLNSNYYLSLFEKPVNNYTYLNGRYDDTTTDAVVKVETKVKGIYTCFWEKYLNERYSKNNKIITCYLNLTPVDYQQFSFNKFIKIDNQIYQVNKIYDYDITTSEPTKVDLITVRNISGYTTNNFDI